MFKQLHLNITLVEALVLMPKYQKMLKALLSNKEKLQELENIPLNEKCSAVILKKLPEKLGDPRKFLISCGFSLPDLIPTRMTLELANRAICMPDGITRDVFVPVGKTARALTDVHGEEMILRDGDERLTLNMKHDTAIYSNHPHRESVNLINIFNLLSKDSGLKDSMNQMDLANFDDYFVDPTPEMFDDEHAPDYSFPPRFDVDDDLPSPNNEDKVFNPGILIHDKSVEIVTRVAQEKKLAISYASLVFEDFDPPFYEPIVFKD
nr:hypothetical protein [Tanacetum cinerariifolium]